MSDLPRCHRCGSPCVDTNEDGDFFFFRCGSSSGQESDACEYVSQLRAAIQTAIGVIDNWKVPLLDPDGKDSSEAVMRLLADDLRKVLEDE